MGNPIYSDIISLRDQISGNQKALYSSGQALYYGDWQVAPTNGANFNEIMMLSITLESGARTQRFYYPYGYNPVNIPKIVYSVVGANDINIIPSHLSQITHTYFEIQFSQPIPNKEYYIEAFVFKDDMFRAFSGTSYDLNPVITHKTLFVDSYYGEDSGHWSGIRENPNFPYESLQLAQDNAFNGDLILVRPGTHNGFNLTKQNLSFCLDDKAILTGYLLNTGYNLNINNFQSSGLTFDNRSDSNLYSNFNEIADNFVINSTLISSGGNLSLGSLKISGSNLNGFLNTSNKPNIYVNDSKFYFSKFSGVSTNFNIKKLETFNVTGYLNSTSSGEIKNSTFNNSTIIIDGGVLLVEDSLFKNSTVELRNNGVIYFDGDNYFPSNLNNIIGTGTVHIQGNLYHNQYPFTTGIDFKINNTLKSTGVYVNKNFSNQFSGINLQYYTDTIDNAINLSPSGGDIFIAPHSYGGFTVNKNLNFYFHKDTIITSKITVNNNCKAYFNDLNLNTSSTSVSSIDTFSSSVVEFDGDCFINTHPSFPNSIDGCGTIKILGNLYHNKIIDTCSNVINVYEDFDWKDGNKRIIVDADLNKYNNYHLYSGLLLLKNNNPLFSGVKEAVDFATTSIPHDFIYIKSGNYHDNTTVVLQKPLSIFFADGAVFSGNFSTNYNFNLYNPKINCANSVTTVLAGASSANINLYGDGYIYASNATFAGTGNSINFFGSTRHNRRFVGQLHTDIPETNLIYVDPENFNSGFNGAFNFRSLNDAISGHIQYGLGSNSGVSTNNKSRVINVLNSFQSGNSLIPIDSYLSIKFNNSNNRNISGLTILKNQTVSLENANIFNPTVSGNLYLENNCVINGLFTGSGNVFVGGSLLLNSVPSPELNFITYPNINIEIDSSKNQAFSGFNNYYIFNNLQSGIDYANSIYNKVNKTIKIHSGNYPSVRISKNYNLETQNTNEVNISGVIVDSASVTFNGLKIQQSSHPTGLYVFNSGKAILNGDCFISNNQLDYAIKGTGDVVFGGVCRYNTNLDPNLNISPLIRKVEVNGDFSSNFKSGLNEIQTFGNLQSGIDYATADQTIYVSNLLYSSGCIINKDLKLRFDKESIISGSIFIQGSNNEVYLYDVTVDTENDITGVKYFLNIPINNTVYLMGDSTIRLPFVLTGHSQIPDYGSTGIKYLASGQGSLFLGNACLYNKLPWSGIFNLGLTGNYYTGISIMLPLGVSGSYWN